MENIINLLKLHASKHTAVYNVFKDLEKSFGAIAESIETLIYGFTSIEEKTEGKDLGIVVNTKDGEKIFVKVYPICREEQIRDEIELFNSIGAEISVQPIMSIYGDYIIVSTKSVAEDCTNLFNTNTYNLIFNWLNTEEFEKIDNFINSLRKIIINGLIFNCSDISSPNIVLDKNTGKLYIVDLQNILDKHTLNEELKENFPYNIDFITSYTELNLDGFIKASEEFYHDAEQGQYIIPSSINTILSSIFFHGQTPYTGKNKEYLNARLLDYTDLNGLSCFLLDFFCDDAEKSAKETMTWFKNSTREVFEKYKLNANSEKFSVVLQRILKINNLAREINENEALLPLDLVDEIEILMSARKATLTASVAIASELKNDIFEPVLIPKTYFSKLIQGINEEEGERMINLFARTSSSARTPTLSTYLSKKPEHFIPCSLEYRLLDKQRPATPPSPLKIVEMVNC